MRKPFFVKGYKVTRENMSKIARWCEGYVITEDPSKPFVLVPVNRQTNKKQSQAYVGTWVVMSKNRGEKSFKVYDESWLLESFIPVEDDIMNDEDEIPGDSDTPALTNVRTLPSQSSNGSQTPNTVFPRARR